MPKSIEDNLNLAVVGHTNTGKTSLMRALLRDAQFGEVANRASTTRHVEALKIGLNSSQNVIFYDTPGMEDAIAVLDCVDSKDVSLRADAQVLIQSFINSEQAESEFAQECKVLRQALKSDLLIYVIDTREPVLGKFIDELKLLAMCAKPILPLLNFSVGEEAEKNIEAWREALRGLNLHVVADYDTVLYNQDHEQLLFDQLNLLLQEHNAILQALVDFRQQQFRAKVNSAKLTIARAVINLAAWQERYKSEQLDGDKLEQFKDQSRAQERNILKQLLKIFDFPEEILALTPLALDHLNWEDDVFDSQTWALYGLDVSSAMAKGGAVGFSIDLFTGGLSLGLGTALGASAGLLLHKGRAIKQKLQGYKVWRLDNNSLAIIYARQQLLLQTLSSRSHANLQVSTLAQVDFERALPKALKKARFKSHWSELNGDYKAHSSSRNLAIEQLIEEL